MMFPKPTFKRRKPTRRRRGHFNKKTRDEILERDNYICQQCGDKGTQIHHIMFKSRGGRGVATNGLTVCQPCHSMIHNDINLSNDWIRHFESFYGKDFYKDEWD